MENNTLTCVRCEQVKPISEFYPDKITKRGYKSYCKPCQRDYQRGWAMKKKELEYGERFAVCPRKLVCRNCGAAFVSKIRAKRHFINKHLNYEN